MSTDATDTHGGPSNSGHPRNLGQVFRMAWIYSSTPEEQTSILQFSQVGAVSPPCLGLPRGFFSNAEALLSPASFLLCKFLQLVAVDWMDTL